MTGTLFGLGVGPGDPELITFKAHRILQAAPVLAYPASETGDSLARRIVAPHLNGDKIESPSECSSAPRFPDETVYGKRRNFSARISAGHDVAVLCEGDPFFYGSFMYLFARVAERHAVEVVPGVSSPMVAQPPRCTACSPERYIDHPSRASGNGTAQRTSQHERSGNHQAWPPLPANSGHAIRYETYGAGPVYRAGDHGERTHLAAGRGRSRRLSLLLDDTGAPTGASMATLGPPAVIVFTEAAYRTAESIRTAFPDAEIYSRSRRVTDGTPFDDPAELLHALFTANRPIIGVCAAGILIRLLAPHLREKQDDPPVLAVSEDGQFCVPLLGGHNAGNWMASEIATSLQGEAAITTATDTRFGVALDDPPHGWVLANPQDAKPFFASLLSGDCIRLIGDADWLSESDLPIRCDGKLKIEISDRKIDGSPRHLVYHRRSLALGVGCERGASGKELMALIDETLTNNELPRDAISGIWSIDLKMDEPAIAEAAANLGAPLRFFSAETLEAETHRLVNPRRLSSVRSDAMALPEAAALAAAGPDAHLLVPKSKSRRATCAIARGGEALDAKQGVRRGSLSLVGIGPGSQEWRTAECVEILRAAEDVVGFTSYINLIEDLNLNASLHPYPIGAETDRVRAAGPCRERARCGPGMFG